jgi:hypothetical protein
VRRLLSYLLFLVAVLGADAAVAGYTIDQCLLAPARESAAVTAMLESPAGQTLAATHVAPLLIQVDPSLTAAHAATLATQAVTNPLLAQTIAVALVHPQTARRGPVLLALAAAVTSADPAVAAQLRADGELPGNDGLLFPVRSAHELTTVSGAARRAAVDGGLAFLTGAGAALAVARRRRPVVRRIGRLVVEAGLVPGLLWYVLPYAVLPRLHSPTAQIAAVGLRTAGGPMAALVGTLLAAGVLILFVEKLSRTFAPVSSYSPPPARERPPGKGSWGGQRRGGPAAGPVADGPRWPGSTGPAAPAPVTGPRILNGPGADAGRYDR